MSDKNFVDYLVNEDPVFGDFHVRHYEDGSQVTYNGRFKLDEKKRATPPLITKNKAKKQNHEQLHK